MYKRQVLAIDMCGPFTPSLSGNLYMFYGVDHATVYIVNYGLRRKSEALAVFKRCVVDMARKAGTAVKCATPSGLAAVSSSSATAWALHESIPRLEHSSTTEWPRARFSGATRSAWHHAVRLSAVWGPRVFRASKAWAPAATGPRPSR